MGKAEVFGVAKKMDRTALKSKYCTRSAAEAFDDLIKQLKCKYIVLSYNNMAQKGNDRSNARISDDDIIRILSAKGEVKISLEGVKALRLVNLILKMIKKDYFYVYVVRRNKMIQSPLNYMVENINYCHRYYLSFLKILIVLWICFVVGAMLELMFIRKKVCL